MGIMCKNASPQRASERQSPQSCLKYCSGNSTRLARVCSSHSSLHTAHSSVAVVQCRVHSIEAIHEVVVLFVRWRTGAEEASPFSAQCTTHHLLDAYVLVFAFEGYGLGLPEWAWLGTSDGS
jgi:hypothetical protein